MATSPIRSTRPLLRAESSVPRPRAARRALEVGQHPDDRDQKPQVLGGSDPGHGQLLQRHLLDVVIQGVDDLVPVGEGLGRLAVTRQQGVGGTGDRLADEGEQLQHFPIDLLEGVVHASHRTRVSG
jgi:hypothetical protein